jgi:two-component system LytT family response regulator/two-component system response regulator AlgR
MKALIVDDEPLARQRLRRLLEELHVEVVGECSDGITALAWLKENTEPDVCFLDIQMPGPSGIEVMAEFPTTLSVVFVTAFDQHAASAFDLEASDYLLKPVSKDRLERCLERLQDVPVSTRKDQSLSLGSRYPVKVGNGYLFMDLKRTTHFEVEEESVWSWVQLGPDGHQRFRTQWDTLAQVETHFAHEGLIRIQRHLLLRVQAILGARTLEGGRISVRVAEGVELEVSRSVTPQIKEICGL